MFKLPFSFSLISSIFLDFFRLSDCHCEHLLRDIAQHISLVKDTAVAHSSLVAAFLSNFFKIIIEALTCNNAFVYG